MKEYVYEPSDDTMLLYRCALRALEPLSNAHCFEAGFGMGTLVLELATKSNVLSIDCSDINENAIRMLSDKIKLLDDSIKNKISLSSKEYIDGFPEKKYDLLLFNPPYLPADHTDRHLSLLEKNSLVGGKKGIETGLEFLKRALLHIHDNSVILVVASSHANIPLFEESARRLGYDISIMESNRIGFETLHCYNAVPGPALSYALNNNTMIEYLSKGSRSYVYSFANNKKIVCKQANIGVESNITKEYEMLQLLKDIIRVPKPYNHSHRILIMERIYGRRADRHDDALGIASFLVNAALILDALSIFKREFSRPYTNLLVGEDNSMCLLDFERSIIGRRHNMNQLCEYLKRQGMINDNDAITIRELNDEHSSIFQEKCDYKQISSLKDKALLLQEYDGLREKYHNSIMEIIKK